MRACDELAGHGFVSEGVGEVGQGRVLLRCRAEGKWIGADRAAGGRDEVGAAVAAGLGLLVDCGRKKMESFAHEAFAYDL